MFSCVIFHDTGSGVVSSKATDRRVGGSRGTVSGDTGEFRAQCGRRAGPGCGISW